MASVYRKFVDRCLGVFASRWLVTIVLILTFDVITFFAFAKSGGSSSFPHQDKVLHALAFFVLTILGHLSLHFDVFRKRQRLSWFLLIFNGMVWCAYGGLVEVGQKMLQYRQASIGDFLADVVGVVLAAFFILALRIYPKPKVEDHG